MRMVEVEERMSSCSQCAGTNTSASKFCSTCGNRLSGEERAAAPVPPPNNGKRANVPSSATAASRRYDLGTVSLVPLFLYVVSNPFLKASPESYGATKRLFLLDWSHFAKDFDVVFGSAIWIVYVVAMFRFLQTFKAANAANAAVATFFSAYYAATSATTLTGNIVGGLWMLFAWAGVWEAYVWRRDGWQRLVANEPPGTPNNAGQSSGLDAAGLS